MTWCFGGFRDSGDYTQVELIQQDGTSKRTLVCWLPAEDAKKAKETAAEISLKDLEGRWRITATYGTKPKDFISSSKMEKMTFDRGDGWMW
jgi:hypothetical protein